VKATENGGGGGLRTEGQVIRQKNNTPRKRGGAGTGNTSKKKRGCNGDDGRGKVQEKGKEKVRSGLRGFPVSRGDGKKHVLACLNRPRGRGIDEKRETEEKERKGPFSSLNRMEREERSGRGGFFGDKTDRGSETGGVKKDNLEGLQLDGTEKKRTWG